MLHGEYILCNADYDYEIERTIFELRLALLYICLLW